MPRNTDSSRSEKVGTRLFFGRKLKNLKKAAYYLELVLQNEQVEKEMFLDGKLGAPMVSMGTETNSRTVEAQKVLSRLHAAAEWRIKQLGLPSPGGNDQDTL